MLFILLNINVLRNTMDEPGRSCYSLYCHRSSNYQLQWANCIIESRWSVLFQIPNLCWYVYWKKLSSWGLVFFFLYFFTVLWGKKVLNFNKVKFINFLGFYGGGECTLGPSPLNSWPRGQEHFAVFFPTLWILVSVGKCLVNLELILISNIR